MIKVQYGDIIFFQGSGLISRLIRFFDKGHWSHVAVVMGEYSPYCVMFLESDFSYGVRLRKLDTLRRNFEIVTPKINPSLSHDEIMREHGKMYDWTHLFSMFLIWCGWKMRADDKNKFICSELVNYAYGFQLCERGQDSPNKLYKILKGEQNAVAS